MKPPEGANVVLVGMMGSGKTAVGEVLAARLGMKLLDTDQLVCDRVGASVSDIFEYGGEEYFRKVEHEVLVSLERCSCVVSTGGGIVTNPRNMGPLKELGVVFYLNTSLEVLCDRLGSAPLNARPILAKKGKAKLRETLAAIRDARHALYLEACDEVIDISAEKTGKHQVARLIMTRLEGRRRA